VVFKRRDRRPWWRALLEVIWPRGGWARAAQYVQHRLRRLPDPPERIARGIGAGVFASFTPFFGLHFLCAALVATVLRGNIIASLLATFVGNPFTYVPIAATSLWFGHLILGHAPSERDIGQELADAWRDVWHNVWAIFTPERMQWDGLLVFYQETFLPFMVGAIVPGILAASIAYYLSVPILRAYQKRRKGLIKAKLEEIKAKAKAAATKSKAEHLGE